MGSGRATSQQRRRRPAAQSPLRSATSRRRRAIPVGRQLAAPGSAARRTPGGSGPTDAARTAMPRRRGRRTRRAGGDDEISAGSNLMCQGHKSFVEKCHRGRIRCELLAKSCSRSMSGAIAPHAAAATIPPLRSCIGHPQGKGDSDSPDHSAASGQCLKG